MTRRSLLKTASAVGAGFALTQMIGESLFQASFAGVKGGNTLVVLSLRGGIDGVGVVVPHGDPGYYSARPRTSVPASSLLCSDSMFGLHPKMAPLAKYWSSKELAAIHAVGLPVANRSHFSAIEAVEDAAPGSQLRSGWINRMVGQANTANHHADPPTFDAVQIGTAFPTTATSGGAPTLATTDLSKLQFQGVDPTYAAQRYASLAALWGGTSTALTSGVQGAISISKGPGADLVNMADNPDVTYPTATFAAPFANPLKSAAKLIRADLGTDVIAIDAGSWDFHSNYGTLTNGNMQQTVSGLAQSLAAFLDDLGSLRSRVTVVTISEFGRRIAENGNQGFDHGWGNMMLVAGAGVRGGAYYGRWPGIDTGHLSQGDLAVTTDYRSVLAEIVTKRFPDRSLAESFPGFSYTAPGIMAGA